MRLYTREAGTGQPMVLLHGNGEDGNYFAGQMDFFSKKYHVIAVDTRGHGHSPRGYGAFTLERFADDLRDFMRERKLGKVILLGFSDGGNIAMIFALKYPQYVDRMILCGANINPFGTKADEFCSTVSKYAAVSLRLAAKKVMGEIQNTQDMRHKKELLALMVYEPWIRPELLSRLKMPVLVIAGSDDVIRESHTEKIARSLPNGYLRILTGNHYIAAERPKEFNQTVDSFLRATEGGEAERMRRTWSFRTPERISEGKIRHSAVLVPLVKKGGEYHVLFEVRAKKLKSQPGEVCFPGGAVEPGETKRKAAVRETMEELLVERRQIEVLAPLDVLETPAGMTLWPFLGILKGYKGTFSTDEVERVFTVPLRWFAEHKPERYRTTLMTVPGEDFPYESVPGGREYPWRRGRYDVLFYRTEKGTIWGMTAKILHALAEMYQAEILR